MLTVGLITCYTYTREEHLVTPSSFSASLPPSRLTPHLRPPHRAPHPSSLAPVLHIALRVSGAYTELDFLHVYEAVFGVQSSKVLIPCFELDRQMGGTSEGLVVGKEKGAFRKSEKSLRKGEWMPSRNIS